MRSTGIGDSFRLRDTSGLKDLKGLSKDLRHTAIFFSAITVVGLVVVLAWSGFTVNTVVALLWSLACLAAGAAVGFLFGIPRIVQGDEVGEVSRDVGMPPAEPRAVEPRAYRQRVNTNLEEISDWLTKIIVGLGLVNLGKIPGELRKVGQTLAEGLSGETAPGQDFAFALALIVYFTLLGLLFGYLYTRLFLQRAFARADLSAMTEGDVLREQVEESSRRALAAIDDSDPEVTAVQREESERVAEVARRTDITLVEKQMRELAAEYERIRENMRSGDSRTRRMEYCITKMRTLAIAAYPLLDDFSKSSSVGLRLAAVAMLQVKPNLDYLDWLVARVETEKPFVGYHAAVGLLTAVRAFGATHPQRLREAIDKAKAAVETLPKDTARRVTLEQAGRLLPPP